MFYSETSIIWRAEAIASPLIVSRRKPCLAVSQISDHYSLIFVDISLCSGSFQHKGILVDGKENIIQLLKQKKV